MPDFQIKKFLGSIFTPDFSMTNALKVASEAYEIIGDSFDGEPTILPVPQDAPVDIPRIILRTSDNIYHINISLLRTNFLAQLSPVPDSGLIDIDNISSMAARFFSEFKNKLNLRVQRMGFVTERVDFDQNALSYILKRFCNHEQIEKGRPFHNAKSFEIHSLKKYGWQGYNINSWVRLKIMTIHRQSDERGQPLLLVENDLNTLPRNEDPGADFSDAQISNYFNEANDHINKILQLYFS
jgi:hypothetical protein